MRKLVYYIGVSLDGYIAGPGGEVDFFPVSDELVAWIGANYPETLPTHIRPHLALEDAANLAFDTVIMGRGTFEPALTVPTTRPYAHLRQYVVSTTIDIDDPLVSVHRSDPLTLVRRLKDEDSDKDIWLAGGGTLAGAVLPAIDQLVIKRYPVIAGAGIPMISEVASTESAPAAFSPTRRESLADGTQVSWFDRI
ncbi:dihydrofolate reductase family protein [Gordonia zhaorongruii]|uniref:dihydrofolate reductase family protein n=1 Tax=Gordonia zhaorongruii TaxID=2597659 RepID=UPI00104541B0|nr:dihydrofolate reductase family protein [Gordonia zhaorongruii]